VTTGEAASHIAGLFSAIQEIREDGFEKSTADAKATADTIGVSSEFTPTTGRARKRMPGELAEDDARTFSKKDTLRIAVLAAVDRILADISKISSELREISLEFEFLSGKLLEKLSASELEECAKELSAKYPSDLNSEEFESEIASFKHQVLALIDDVATATPLDLLNFLHRRELEDVYPNIEIAIRIYLSLPVTVASCERSFSKLKLIKSYLRSAMGQERLSNLAILSIEHAFAKNVNFDAIIDSFAARKARKVLL